MKCIIGKVIHKDFDAASKAIGGMNGRRRSVMRAYFCCKCAGYHLTSKARRKAVTPPETPSPVR